MWRPEGSSGSLYSVSWFATDKGSQHDTRRTLALILFLGWLKNREACTSLSRVINFSSGETGQSPGCWAIEFVVLAEICRGRTYARPKQHNDRVSKDFCEQNIKLTLVFQDQREKGQGHCLGCLLELVLLVLLICRQMKSTDSAGAFFYEISLRKKRWALGWSVGVKVSYANTRWARILASCLGLWV